MATADAVVIHLLLSAALLESRGRPFTGTTCTMVGLLDYMYVVVPTCRYVLVLATTLLHVVFDG